MEEANPWADALSAKTDGASKAEEKNNGPVQELLEAREGETALHRSEMNGIGPMGMGGGVDSVEFGLGVGGVMGGVRMWPGGTMNNVGRLGPVWRGGGIRRGNVVPPTNLLSPSGVPHWGGERGRRRNPSGPPVARRVTLHTENGRVKIDTLGITKARDDDRFGRKRSRREDYVGEEMERNRRIQRREKPAIVPKAAAGKVVEKNDVDERQRLLDELQQIEQQIVKIKKRD